ncbi:kinase-like domain-containing protein, partial [Cladochytrium replicatum]
MQRALNALKRAVATLKTTHHLPVPEPEVHDWTITSWEVEMLNPIARGGFGEVLRGVWLGHVDVAVKRLHMKLDTTRVRQDFLREVRAWYPLRHPNVLELLGACASAERPFMISPLMTGGHALQYLERHPVSASRSLKLLYEIALGMSYLHSRRVIHADLKAINVLVDGNGRAVVADFGFAVLKKVTTTQSTSTMGGMAGTLRWMSPERLQGGKPTVYVDIYAFAMTCFEVLSRGDIPFSDIPDPLIYSSVVLNHVRPS